MSERRADVIVAEVRRCWLCLRTFLYVPEQDDPERPAVCTCRAAYLRDGRPA